MKKCPSCGAELDESADICITCGNPLEEGKPWDKKEKGKKTSSSYEVDHDAVKVKHQKRRPASGQYERAVAAMQKEYYLDNEFVIREGYCGYRLLTDQPEDEGENRKEKLQEGTVILTKRVILFGPSDHAIRCGKFVYEIPVEVVEYVTDTTYLNKPALLIHTKDGEDFKMFVTKRDQWIHDLRYVVTYQSADNIEKNNETESGDAEETKEGLSFRERWARPICYFIAAAVLIIYSFVRSAGFSLLFFCLGFAFIALAVAAIIVPGKVRFF